jgi:vancomycin resistance protein VanJ
VASGACARHAIAVRHLCLGFVLAVAAWLGCDRRRATAAPPPPVADGAFTLLTYNVQYDNPDIPGTLDAIAAADADVVLLQEVSAAWRDALEARFADTYPHRIIRVHDRRAGGLAVLSKLPITHEDWLPAPERWFPAQRLVLAAPFGPIQVLNVHLRPAIDQGSWVRGYLTTPPIRQREIAAYWAQLATDLPTLVAGDFNEAPGGKALTFLAAHGLARVPSTGPPTWHYVATSGPRGDVLALDIDHVVVDATLAADHVRALDVGSSDHRPVAATIRTR